MDGCKQIEGYVDGNIFCFTQCHADNSNFSPRSECTCVIADNGKMEEGIWATFGKGKGDLEEIARYGSFRCVRYDSCGEQERERR